MSQNLESITLTPEQAATLMQALAQVEAVLKELPLAPVQCEMRFMGTKRVEVVDVAAPETLPPVASVEERAPARTPAPGGRPLRLRQRLQRHRTRRLHATASTKQLEQEIPAAFHV